MDTIGISTSASAVAPVGQSFRIPGSAVTLNKDFWGNTNYSIVGPSGNTYTIPLPLVNVSTSLWDESRALIMIPGTYLHFTYTDGSTVMVKYAAETYDLFVDYGFLPRGATRPSGGQNTGGLFGGVSVATILTMVTVIAVIGAAVYFIPGDVVKGAIRKGAKA